MAQANINIRVDADLKQDFERLCRDIGITVSTALTLFMKQAVRANRLPISLDSHKNIITEQGTDMGMTDLQFKSYIRKLLSLTEDITEESSKEEMFDVLSKLRRDLEEDLRG